MLTIKELAINYYLPEKRIRRRANTVDGYESSINKHVIPKFGDRRLDGITRDEMQSWIDGFDLAGAAEKAYKCIRQMFRWAIRKWALQIPDPTIGIELPRKKAYRPKVLNAKQLTMMLRGFWGSDYEATLILSCSLGLRPGECYAIDWRDIDMRSGSVTISKTLQETSEGLKLYHTKTAQSDRIVYLPKWARTRLKDIWRESGKPRDRIIGQAKPSKVSRKIRSWSERNDLPSLTMQNARHTWATLAISAGVAIETVSMMLGHSSIQTAYEHYIRPSKSIMESAQAQVTKYLERYA